MSNSQKQVKGKPKSGIQYGSPEWNAADEVAKSFQGSANEIRAGRERAGGKISDRWNDWYNNLMVICFTLGGALIAVATAVKFKTRDDQFLFWAGDILLIINGLYILLLRKAAFEKDSVSLLTMGYEIEYYSLVAKNKVLDILRGEPFNLKEYEAAKDKLLNTALADLDDSYEESRNIDAHMDVITALFIISLELLILSSVKSQDWLILCSILALLLTLCLLLFLKRSAIKPKEAIKERDNWLGKIKGERK